VAYQNQQLVVGDTAQFILYARKNGVTWDITGGTVLLYLWKKDSSSTSGPYTATLTTPTSGEADYTVATTVLDSAGTWFRQWKITVGSIVMRSNPIQFLVLAART
jgi:hypothetical protein